MQPARSLPRTAGDSFLCRQARGMAARGEVSPAAAGIPGGRPVCGLFLPARGKEPMGDRGQLIRTGTSAAHGHPAAWVQEGIWCCARLSVSSPGRLGTRRGYARHLPAAHRPPSLRAGWHAVGCARACRRSRLPEGTRCGSAHPPHSRRSMRNLRRSPQEVAVSLSHDGASKHGRTGATAGYLRPCSTNERPSPAGKVARLCRGERGKSRSTASRRVLRAPCYRAMMPPTGIQRAMRPLARVWGEKLLRPQCFPHCKTVTAPLPTGRENAIMIGGLLQAS